MMFLKILKNFKGVIILRSTISIVFLALLYVVATKSVDVASSFLGRRFVAFGINFVFLFDIAWGFIGISLVFWLFNLLDKYILYFLKCVAIVQFIDGSKQGVWKSIAKASERFGSFMAMFLLNSGVQKVTKTLGSKLVNVPVLSTLSKIPFLKKISSTTISYVDECIFYQIYSTDIKLASGICKGLIEYVRDLPVIFGRVALSVVMRTIIPWIGYVAVAFMYWKEYLSLGTGLYMVIIIKVCEILYDAVFWDVYMCLSIIAIHNKAVEKRKYKKQNDLLDKVYSADLEDSASIEDVDEDEAKKVRWENFNFEDGEFSTTNNGVFFHVKGRRYNLKNVPFMRELLKDTSMFDKLFNIMK